MTFQTKRANLSKVLKSYRMYRYDATSVEIPEILYYVVLHLTCSIIYTQYVSQNSTYDPSTHTYIHTPLFMHGSFRGARSYYAAFLTFLCNMHWICSQRWNEASCRQMPGDFAIIWFHLWYRMFKDLLPAATESSWPSQLPPIKITLAGIRLAKGLLDVISHHCPFLRPCSTLVSGGGSFEGGSWEGHEITGFRYPQRWQGCTTSWLMLLKNVSNGHPGCTSWRLLVIFLCEASDDSKQHIATNLEIWQVHGFSWYLKRFFLVFCTFCESCLASLT